MKFLQIGSVYPKVLRAIWAALGPTPALTWGGAVRTVVRSRVGDGHLYSDAMGRAGWDSHLLIANDPFSQALWARENGVHESVETARELVRLQVEAIRPDVLFVQDPITYDASFLRSLSRRPDLVYGWRAASIPTTTDFSEFDFLLTNTDVCRRKMLSQGARVVHETQPVFSTEIVAECGQVETEWDVTFSGQWTPEHGGRNALLLDLSKAALSTDIEFSLGYFLMKEDAADLPAGVAMHDQGPRFGLDMFRALRSGRSTLHFPVDIAGGEVRAMRIFEATGMGVPLFVLDQPGIGATFEPGREIVTYQDGRDLVEKLRHYLAHPAELEAIGRRGQERCHRDHSADARAKELDALFRRHLSGRTNPPAPSVRPGAGTTIQELFQRGVAALEAENPSLALEISIEAKALRVPAMGIDMLRAAAFLRLGRRDEGISALREELRHFPDNIQARELFERLPETRREVAGDGSEFGELLALVRPYTMLSTERLESLYRAALRICQDDLPGNFVECGVAAGGSSALLCGVVARHSRRPRLVFSLDTFEGMPPPTAEDSHQGMSADATGWGTGTCAAPVGSLLEACARTGGSAHLVPVKGLFQDTLPLRKAEMGAIALLHMDGDWYDSTMAILREVYDQVEADGFVQIDDYGHWDGCRKAVHEFEAARGLKFELTRIDATGAWMRKPGAARALPGDQRTSRVPSLSEGGVYLNVGCGSRISAGWRNLDLRPALPGVERLESHLGLPAADASTDLVYSSHMLEHLPPGEVPSFLRECHRILKPGGVLRMVVPDLEGIARQYLKELEAAVAGDREASLRRDWMVLEMLDQVARHRSGGEMLRWWSRDPVPAQDFILSRVGSEARQAIRDLRANPAPALVPEPTDPGAIGGFRLSGEVHRWMYDRHSLAQLLLAAGFRDPRRVSAAESGVPGFAGFHLDTEPDGSVRKPDSLFMEATR